MQNISDKNQMKTVSLKKNQQLWHDSYGKLSPWGQFCKPWATVKLLRVRDALTETSLSWMKKKMFFQVRHIFNVHSPIYKIRSWSAREKLNFRLQKTIEVHCIEIFLSLLKELLFYWWSYLSHKISIAARNLHCRICKHWYSVSHGS